MGRHGAVTFKGNPLTLVGEEVKVGVTAPEFDLACFGANGMQHITKADIVGKPTIISVYGIDASARATPNSACTAGSTTAMVYIAPEPMVIIVSVTISRNQA